jgi:plasmid stability protein
MSDEEAPMAAMTVRNIPDDVHKALKRRAKRHGRSAEAEVRSILQDALGQQPKVGLGTALLELGRKIREAGGEFEPVRDTSPARYVDFSGPEFDGPDSHDPD